MPEPVSIALGCWLGLAVLHPLARPGSAVSAAARDVTNAALAVARSTETSQVLFGEKAVATSQLRCLARDCAVHGWDGEDAVPVEWAALLQAERFVQAMPEGVRMPDFAAEPDGSISLDWIQSRTRLFSLSIGSGNRLAFAWLDGTDKGHGVVRFDGFTVPPRVLEGIQSIIGRRDASLRVA